MRLKIYVSAPLSTGGNDRLENVKAAVAVGKQLIEQGFAPLIPHLTHYADAAHGCTFDHDVWMEVDMPWLKESDAVFRIPGLSKGAQLEHDHAVGWDIPVFTNMDELCAWRDRRESDRLAESLSSMIPDPPAAEHPLASWIKDSGERSEFPTGAVRDMQTGKGRFDLLMGCVHALTGVAKVFEAGAMKYGDRNWEKGQPTACFANSASRHLVKYVAGMRDEPHLFQAIWNLICLAETEGRIDSGRLPESLRTLAPPIVYEEERAECG